MENSSGVGQLGFTPRLVVGAVVSALIFGVSAGPASAAEGPIDEAVEAIAQQVAEASPDGATAVQGIETSDAFATTSGVTLTSIPLDANEPVVVETSIGEATVAAEIRLPSELSVSSASVSDNGTVVFPSSTPEGTDEDGASLAVQTLEGGDTRVQTIIPNADAAHEYTYAMNGYQAVIDEEGNAGFLGTGQEGLLIPVEAAWAVDANGLAVPTHYQERDGALVQIIEPTAGTTYPIVADPTWGWRNAAYGVTLSRSEVSTATSYSGALSMCAALMKFAKGRFSVACGAWAGYLNVQASTANRQNPKGCLHLVVAPLPGALLHVRC